MATNVFTQKHTNHTILVEFRVDGNLSEFLCIP
jgi:hypothetical protein